MSRRPTKNHSNQGDGVSPSFGTAEDDWVAVGQVVGVFGTRGELKIEPLTDFPERFAETAIVYAGKERRQYHVAGARIQKQQVILQFKEVDSVEDAEKLRGEQLWIPLAEIMPVPEGQFYIHDLIGLNVEHVSGQRLGKVVDVLTLAGRDLFLIRSPDGREVLLPAVKEFVRSVNLEARTLTVDPIPGLFDDNAEVVEE